MNQLGCRNGVVLVKAYGEKVPLLRYFRGAKGDYHLLLLDLYLQVELNFILPFGWKLAFQIFVHVDPQL